MNSWAIRIWMVGAGLQVLLIIGLLAISLGDALHLQEAVNNGEKLVAQLSASASSETLSNTGTLQLIPVLASANEVFRRLLDLFQQIGIVLSLALLAQGYAVWRLSRSIKK